ncbi:MAG: HAD family hydrolase [Candidatus Helarchaeota archaeon]|nr:HAD family hydrolase [Candidatus Helarchaeota archaeon]
MKIENILFDMGFTLITFKNFSVKKYVLSLKKNIEYLQSYLIDENIISNINFGQVLKENQKKYFQKSFITDDEYSIEFILKESFKEIGLSSKEITDELIDNSAKVLYSKDAENWKAYPDSESTLKSLKERGFKLAIVSNAPWHGGVVQILKLNKLSKYFDTIISSALAKVRKPKPGIFNLALSNLNAEISNSIFIGDDLYCDIFGAQKLGMKAIHFNKGFELPSPKTIDIKPDERIDKISQIIPIIEKWSNGPI